MPLSDRGTNVEIDGPLGLTVSEAATILRVHKNTIYRLVQKGRLPGVRIGRRLFVPRKAGESLFDTGSSGYS